MFSSSPCDFPLTFKTFSSSSSPSPIVITISFLDATGVLYDSVEGLELPLPVAMDTDPVISSEAVSCKDEVDDSLDAGGCGESDESGIVSSDAGDVDGSIIDMLVIGRRLGAVFSVLSWDGVGEVVEDVKSKSQMSKWDVSETEDTEAKDSDWGVVVVAPIDTPDKDNVVNEESKDFDSGFSLTVQPSVLYVSVGIGTAINGVDFGAPVSVHIFCCCVSGSVD